MDRFLWMPDREGHSRIGEEGKEGASRIPNVGVDDRLRVPEYPFFHEGRLDNLNAFSANRGVSGVLYRSPSPIERSVDSPYTQSSSGAMFNNSTPMEMLGEIGYGRVNEKVQRKGRLGKRLVQQEKAVWTEQKHAIFVRLCLEQKIVGNKPTNTLNKVEYENLEREFLRQIGTHYVRSQLKNHWDSTRRDWQIWKALGKQTRIGWDAIRKTNSQTPEWWENFGKTWPGAEKFAQVPLAHEGDLDALFWEGAALGEDMYIPSSGVIPPDDQQNFDEYVEVSMEDEDTFEGSIGTRSPLERNGREESQEQSTDRKSKSVDVGGNAMQKKRRKLSTGDKIELAMEGVCEALKA
ncbi:hypothetical protein Taro_000549 [Colocasia esculenta]|uniref:Myb/SANT-like domain-containing protein n=1 Tax=Colocasia esculenta TaxID=4460 RepID=A0A843TB42_COLES|nr:hypothetical protein [Colocasia esculenta]